MTRLEFGFPLGRTLREQALARLRTAIVRGELAPGEALRQDQLAEWLGVSSTPVREALADLAREQLVDLEPNRGARVRPLTRKGSLEFARTCRLLFEAGYAWGLPNLTDEDYARIAALNEELRQCCSGGDYSPAFDLDTAIHEVVFQATDNADLVSIMKSLQSRAHRLLTLRMPQNIWDDHPATYDRLFAAAKVGAFAEAGSILSQAWDRMLAMLSAAIPAEADEAAL